MRYLVEHGDAVAANDRRVMDATERVSGRRY